MTSKPEDFQRVLNAAERAKSKIPQDVRSMNINDYISNLFAVY